MSVTLQVVITAIRHQGQPAAQAAWALGRHQGTSIAGTAAAAADLAAYHAAYSRHQLRHARACTWGSFAQRTIDRRYCGILAADMRSILQCSSDYYGTEWYFRAASLAGGHPSPLCYTPFRHA